ncbi:putative cytochrome P450 [Stipitochalara longipes BDJ]|nr:putative cytochrome P450 [Stipitochalara longipes BDJ]
MIIGFFYAQISTWRYPAEVVRVREPEGKRTFSFRTRLAYYTDARELFREAFEKYSRFGKTCLLPSIGSRNEVILPPSALRWITTQGDHVLNGPEAIIDMDSFDWTTGHRKYLVDPWQGLVLKRDMNAVLENLMVALNDELQFCFLERFGTNTKEWTELDIYETMQMVIAQGSSRFTVGLPLCRKESYLRHNIKMGNLYMLVGGILGLVPMSIRNFIGPLVALPCRIYQRKINQALKPLFTERMKYLKTPPKENPDEPQDHFQMILRFAQKERPEELNIDDIGTRLVVANFGSFHQTAIAATNVLLNILHSNAQYNTIAILRAEIAKVLAEFDGVWSRAAVAKMVRCDSVLRETLRINAFGARNMLRKVMVNNLKTEDGIVLPKGCDVSILSFSNQTDDDVFEFPYEFIPFRYAELREAAGPRPLTSNLSFVSTGTQYLPFGHGKHACPGRFLVDFELKMILAYILLNYDIEFPEVYEGKRPDVRWVAEVLMPPNGAKIRVRRCTEKEA